MSEVVLRGEQLTRRWGGLVAVNAVSLALRRGEVHAVIGTNGAGKSTLIHLLSGELPASSGRVELQGQDVSHWPQPRRARAGLGRSYQRTTVFGPFSVLENCRLAAQAAHQRPWRWWQAVHRQAEVMQAAEAVASRVGLGEALAQPAGLLSHGQKRQLEVAMCLATSPRVLLLDEPLAGMSASEGEAMVALLQHLRSRYPILLVEHDMGAVFALADRISVLVYGRVIATGTPAEIRANADVRTAYLGEEGLVA